MKKKWIALLLTLLLTLTLAACGTNGSTSASGGSAESSSDSAQSAEIEESSDVSDELENLPANPAQSAEDAEDAENAEDVPAVSETKPEVKPVEKPTTTKPSGTVNKPADKPSGDTSTSKPQTPAAVDLTAFYTTLSSDPNFPTMMALEGESLDTFYTGLNDLKPKQCLVYTPMISAVAYEIALVEVGSADVKSVQDIFQARIDYQIEQGAFYPATVECWQNNAKIVTNGNYVMLICGTDADTVAQSFNALFA